MIKETVKDLLKDSDEMSLGSDIIIADEEVSANRPLDLDRPDLIQENSFNVSSISSFQYS